MAIKTDRDTFADINEPVTFSPMYGDDLPDPAEFNDPAYLVEQLEVETIELFGVNLVGHQVA